MADFKFSCPGCGQHISCDTGYVGMQINCPSCKQAIVVPQSAAAPVAPAAPRLATAPPPPPSAPPALGTRQTTTAPAAGQRFTGAGAPPPKPKSKVLKIVVGVTSALVGLAVGYFGVTMALKHFGGGKSKGNPAAQVAVPTSQSTIQALSILTKVHAAYTNSTSAKADVTFTMFLDLSNLTMADVSPKPPADPKVAARRPPGMPKFFTNSTELTVKRAPTNWYYFAGDALVKVDRMNMTNTFAFWSSDKGKFSFNDSHMRGVQPRYMQLPDMTPKDNPMEQFKSIQHVFDDPANLNKIVKDLGQTADEPVNGQDCYTLTAKVLGQKVKVWVDKGTYLISQWQIVLGGEITDADIDDAFSLAALAITNVPPAALEMGKTQFKKMKGVATKIRGSLAATTRNLEVNPVLTSDDFNYPVPSGVRLIPLRTPQQRQQTTTANTSSTTTGSTLEERQRNACINNLRQIDGAKNEWALEQRKKDGDACTEDDLKPYIKLSANESSKNGFPTCPANGKYTIGKVGETPTCSVDGHKIP